MPTTADRSIEVVDRLSAGNPAAALVLEHVAGRGPYKARTQVHAIASIVRESEGNLKAHYLESWAKLTQAAAATVPMDLQVILADDGRIVTIDPEKVGPGVPLKDLF